VTGAAIATLLRHAWSRHRVPLIPIALAVALFEFLLTRIAPAVTEVNWMNTLMQTLPPEIIDLVGNDLASTPGKFLALGYGHPFFVILLGTWVVRTTNAAVAGEVGAGTMDLLASRPVSRWQFVASGFLASALGLTLIIVSAFMGTAFGVSIRDLGVVATDFIPVAAGAWLMFAAWTGVGLLISATRRDGGQAISWMTAIIVLSFVLDYLARLWTPIFKLRSLSLFRYFEPQAIFGDGLPAITIIVLTSTLVVTVLGAIVAIRRRDL
jgi:ABC-2 type transport system permease protein